MENKFTTEDGFQLGYALGRSTTWFIVLERYGESTILFDNAKIQRYEVTL